MSDFFGLWMRVFFTLLIIVWIVVYIITKLKQPDKVKLKATRKEVHYSIKQLKEVK